METWRETMAMTDAEVEARFDAAAGSTSPGLEHWRHVMTVRALERSNAALVRLTKLLFVWTVFIALLTAAGLAVALAAD